MREQLPVLLLMWCLIVMTGCRSINKGITTGLCSKTPKQTTASFSMDCKYTLTDSKLEEMDFAGTVTVGENEVSYQKGLESQANDIANQIDMLVSHVQASTGLEIPYKTKVYLCRVEQIPQSYNMNLERELNEFRMPLFVEAGNESFQTIIGQNASYPYVFMHEITEMSLMWSQNGGRVLPDVAWEFFLLKGNVRNYTRWFRDGFSNYAGYIAYEKMHSEMETEITLTMLPKVHEQPFSSLSKVGKELFKWRQYSDDQLNHDYYNAALGLFLLIRERFGEEAIREIVLEVKKRKCLDGHDLVRITNQVLDADIEELAEGFEFPETGLEIKSLKLATSLNKGYEVTEGLLVTSVATESLAEGAGIKRDDVILAINGKGTKNNLDFELAVFDSMEEQRCELLIWREGDGKISRDLQLVNQLREGPCGK